MDKIYLDSIKKIQRAIQDDKLCLFVGAGISVNSGAPSYKDVIKSFAEDLGYKKEKDENEYNKKLEYIFKNIDNFKPNEIHKFIFNSLKPNKKDDYSQDEYLKIPQYYFNEKGEDEYLKKLKDIFKNIDNFKQNEIHKLIFDSLKPKYIITTNYDNLLGKEFPGYYVVKEDKDIPNIHSKNVIIKMHGDFSKNNIVLKEDDYLSYSKNFTLIETYIKAIVASHTVLFIGYSVNDINVKMIFNSIKDILGEKTKKAYLLNIDTPSTEENKEIIDNYYKNQNIIRIPYTKIKDEIEDFLKKNDNIRQNIEENIKSLKEIGRDTYKSLFFLTYDELYEIKEVVDYYYQKLKILKKLNSYTNKDILDLLNEDYDIKNRNRYYNIDISNVLISNNVKFKILIDAIRDNLIYLLPEKLFLEYLKKDKKLCEKYDISDEMTNENRKLKIENFKKDNQTTKKTRIVKKLKIILSILTKNNFLMLKYQSSYRETLYTKYDDNIELPTYIFYPTTEVNLYEFSKFFKPKKEEIEKFFQKIYNFDYIGLKQLVEDESYNPSKTKPINVFYKAYYFYRLCKYEKAKEELNKIHDSYKKNPLINAIFENNRGSILRLQLDKDLQNPPPRPISYETFYSNHKVKNEIDLKEKEFYKQRRKVYKINTDETFPYIAFIMNNYKLNAFKECFYNINKHKWVHFNSISLPEEFFSYWYNALFFCFCSIIENFLFLNLFYPKNLKQIEGTFKSDILELIDIVFMYKFNGYYYRINGYDHHNEELAKEFIYIEFYIMIEYLNNEELIKFIDKYKKIYDFKNLKCNEEDKNRLIESFENIINCIINKLEEDNFTEKIIDKMNNFMILFSNISLSKEEKNKIFNKFFDLYKNYELSLSIFYKHYLSKYIDCIDFNILDEFLNSIAKHSYYFNFKDKKFCFDETINDIIQGILKFFKNKEHNFTFNKDVEEFFYTDKWEEQTRIKEIDISKARELIKNYDKKNKIIYVIDKININRRKYIDIYIDDYIKKYYKLILTYKKFFKSTFSLFNNFSVEFQEKTKNNLNLFCEKFSVYDLYFDALKLDILKPNEKIEYEIIKILKVYLRIEKKRFIYLKKINKILIVKLLFLFIFASYDDTRNLQNFLDLLLVFIKLDKFTSSKNKNEIIKLVSDLYPKLFPYNNYYEINLINFLKDMENFDYAKNEEFCVKLLYYLDTLSTNYILEFKRIIQKNEEIKNIIQNTFSKIIYGDIGMIDEWVSTSIAQGETDKNKIIIKVFENYRKLFN